VDVLLLCNYCIYFFSLLFCLFFSVLFAWPVQCYALVECTSEFNNASGKPHGELHPASLRRASKCSSWRMHSHFLQVGRTELKNPLLIRSIKVNQRHYGIYSSSIPMTSNMKKTTIFVHHLLLRTKCSLPNL
jgi:hypothetical protein